MKIQTEEYCRQCPWYQPELGWLEDNDPYWETHKSGCMCEDCPRRTRCESGEPEQDAGSCLVARYITK